MDTQQPLPSQESASPDAPLQTLKLADDLFAQLDDRGKRVSIRLGRKSLALGPLALVGATNTALRRIVQVVEVRYARLCDLRPRDLEGYPVREVGELAQSLRRHYPDIEDTSPITYVRFET